MEELSRHAGAGLWSESPPGLADSGPKIDRLPSEVPEGVWGWRQRAGAHGAQASGSSLSDRVLPLRAVTCADIILIGPRHLVGHCRAFRGNRFPVKSCHYSDLTGATPWEMATRFLSGRSFTCRSGRCGSAAPRPVSDTGLRRSILQPSGARARTGRGLQWGVPSRPLVRPVAGRGPQRRPGARLVCDAGGDWRVVHCRWAGAQSLPSPPQ